MRESRQRESPPTLWPTGMMGMDVPSFMERLRRAQALDGGSVDEAAEAEIEEGAQLDELLHAHLALSVQDVPQPLSIHADTTSKLGYAYPAIPSQVLNMFDDSSLVDMHANRLIRHDGIA